MTLSTSYAFGDTFGIRNSLHRSWREAKPFYAMFTTLVMLAAGLVLIPNAPLGLITTAVQALAGVMLPSACLFLLFLCNDRDVLGPWVNRPVTNVLATVILGRAADALRDPRRVDDRSDRSTYRMLFVALSVVVAVGSCDHD